MLKKNDVTVSPPPKNGKRNLRIDRAKAHLQSKVAPRYQDFVIRDGKLVGDFEGLYKNFEDPWHQSHNDQLQDS